MIYLAELDKVDDLLSKVRELGNLNMIGNTYLEWSNIPIDYIINLKLEKIGNQNVDIECDVQVPDDLEMVLI